MSIFLSRIALTLLLLTAKPAFASFAYRGTFTVQAAQMGSSQTDFPFAIYWTDNVLKQTGSGGQVTDAQGDDIRPYSNSDCATGALTYQRYFYDGTAGTVYLRVKDTGGVGHVIYLCVGDSGVTTDGSSTSTWNANFLGAWPFADGTTLSLLDKTANANNGTGTNTPTATTGKLDGGMSLVSASNQYVSAGTAINPTAITIMAWVKATSFPHAYNAVVSHVQTGSTTQQILVKSDGTLAVFVRDTSGAPFYDGTGSHTLSTGTFYHLAATFSSATGLIGYVDGASDGTAASSNPLQNADAPTWSFGEDLVTTGRQWDGVFDEIQIMDIAASADWVGAEHNMGDQAAFWGTVTFSSTASGTGYTTLRGIVRP